MKLRNKETGEVMGMSMAGDIVWVGNYRYESLARLNRDWEDYEPKEPLIKDKKIRKVVRAWAELNSIEEVTYAESERENGALFILTDISDGDYVIELAGWVPTLIDDKEYTIAELCGEEEL